MSTLKLDNRALTVVKDLFQTWQTAQETAGGTWHDEQHRTWGRLSPAALFVQRLQALHRLRDGCVAQLIHQDDLRELLCL